MRRILPFILGFIITSAVLIVVVLGFIVVTAPDHYNVLFVGSDQRGTERARSDVLFVVSVPKSSNKQPYFLTIPRDTYIEHEEWGMQKMTHFYALGERPDDEKALGNIELTRSVIEELLDIKVDATVEVTFQSFEEIINTLGGAVLEGQVVDGPAALAVVRDRFTGDRSDFDRQADAREILRSLVTKIKKPSTVKSLLAYFNDAEQARLDYGKTKLIYFLVGAGISRKGQVSIGEMEEEALPGYGDRIYTPDFGKELYYWIPDEEAIVEIMQQHFK
ncbi:MAG: LCP family protein [Candidatus Kerfeldbacteria bacterium]